MSDKVKYIEGPLLGDLKIPVEYLLHMQVGQPTTPLLDTGVLTIPDELVDEVKTRLLLTGLVHRVDDGDRWDFISNKYHTQQYVAVYFESQERFGIIQKHLHIINNLLSTTKGE